MTNFSALIPVTETSINSFPTLTINGRDLHGFLDVKRDYTTWIKARIEKYDFQENQDFVIDSPILGNQTGRGGDRKSIDYILTTDMGKQLAMVENNEKGRQVRRYFIECERHALEAAQQGRETFRLTDERDPNTLSTVKDRGGLTKLVGVWTGLDHVTRSDAWQMLHVRYQVAKVDDMTIGQVRAAELWLQERIDVRARNEFPQNPKNPKNSETPEKTTTPHAELLLPELLTESQLAEAAHLHDECARLSKDYYHALNKFLILINCALVELSNHHTFNDVPPFAQLANLMDSHRIRLHGFSNAGFAELSRTADHCRRVVKFIETFQMKTHKQIAL